MPCTPRRMPDGSVAILCGPSRVPRKPCVGCGQPATRLCDFALDAQETCSAPVCASCTQRLGRSEDRCPQHYTSRLAPTRQGTLDFGD